MDVHVPRAVTEALRAAGVDVLTAQEDSSARLADSQLLDRATALRRALVTQDDDFLAEGARRLAAGIPFSGIVYAHQMRITIGQLVRDLNLLAQALDPADLANRIEHLPLR